MNTAKITGKKLAEYSSQSGIRSIPANFLIDPTGKIVARDLRGADLDKFLATNLK